MPLFFKHFWIAFVLATSLNAGIWWFRGKRHRERDPSLTDGYRSLVRGLVTWGNLPWLVMGAGILTGSVPSIFHYFDAKSPNPYVKAWFGSIILLWIAGTYWLFARKGAEQLIRHPGIFQPEISSAAALKVFWLLAIAGGILGLSFMYFGNFKPPNF